LFLREARGRRGQEKGGGMGRRGGEKRSEKKRVRKYGAGRSGAEEGMSE
jgi:hypothetical protein